MTRSAETATVTAAGRRAKRRRLVGGMRQLYNSDGFGRAGGPTWPPAFLGPDFVTNFTKSVSTAEKRIMAS